MYIYSFYRSIINSLSGPFVGAQYNYFAQAKRLFGPQSN